MSVITGRRKPSDKWLPEDTAAALAWQAYVGDLCPGCGHPQSESTSEDHERSYRAPEPIRCHACTAIGVAKREWDAANRKADYSPPPGLYWSAERR